LRSRWCFAVIGQALFIQTTPDIGGNNKSSQMPSLAGMQLAWPQLRTCCVSHVASRGVNPTVFPRATQPIRRAT
jgi:hypothetical protein